MLLINFDAPKQAYSLHASLLDSNSNVFTANNLTGATLTAAQEDYYNNRTGPLTATLIESIAYLPLSSLSSDWESLINQLSSADPNTYPSSDIPEEVRMGCAAQYAALVQSLGSSTEGVVESCQTRSAQFKSHCSALSLLAMYALYLLAYWTVSSWILATVLTRSTVTLW